MGNMANQKNVALNGRGRKASWNGIGFILPSFAGILIFTLFPYLDVIKRSVTQAVTGEFVGLTNFKKVIQNEAFRLATVNTVHLIAVCVPILVLLSLLIAV